MKVLVSDTCVLVDLERGSFLETSFRLPYEFAVPDLLYERELKDYGGDKLVELGLRIEELDGDGVASAIAYRHQHPSLSLPDCFALALARANSWILLTGDGGLRELANDECVDCHGVLWLVDRIQETAVATVQELNAGLAAIGDHPRCRLPRAEIRKLMMWKCPADPGSPVRRRSRQCGSRGRYGHCLKS
jgi:predicted nucleic acid-binding protein